MNKMMKIFFFQAEDGIRDGHVNGVQTCALPISRRHVPVRVQRRERGGRAGVPRRADRISGHRLVGRAGARRRRRLAGARPRRARRVGCGGPPPRRGARAMNVLVSILGLALLILVHEAGHFFTALAVKMRPRKFYIGFPPAVAKVKRNGIEYGIGAIPLGGYVKIPGMHRPAGPDLDVGLERARKEAPELTGPIARVERPLEAGDLEGARAALAELEAAVAAADLSPSTRA